MTKFTQLCCSHITVLQLKNRYFQCTFAYFQKKFKKNWNKNYYQNIHTKKVLVYSEQRICKRGGNIQNSYHLIKTQDLAT